jgi:alkylation response protein AidB-like acyl-CoA dehydrogenase
MRLTPTAEQAELKAAVRRFCEEQISADRLQAWAREPRGVDEASWRAMAALGWFGLGLPVRADGSGLGLVEVACLLEECARGLVPQVVITAIRGARTLASLDAASPELAALGRGERTVTLAFHEENTSTPEHCATHLEAPGGRSIVTGEKWYVADGAAADFHIVAAREEAGVALVLIARDGLDTKPLRTFDGLPQVIVRYDRAPVLRRLTTAPAAGEAFRRVLREEQALALAEQVGTMGAALDMAVAYVKEREQFGQKIGVFQAVQHQIADMATAYTASRHLAWQSITRLAAGTEEGTEIDTAAAFVGQTCKRITLTAHHLHGGAGYVIEHPLHYHSERAQAYCIRYTPEGTALARVAASLLGEPKCLER